MISTDLFMVNRNYNNYTTTLLRIAVFRAVENVVQMPSVSWCIIEEYLDKLLSTPLMLALVESGKYWSSKKQTKVITSSRQCVEVNVTRKQKIVWMMCQQGEEQPVNISENVFTKTLV